MTSSPDTSKNDDSSQSPSWIVLSLSFVSLKTTGITLTLVMLEETGCGGALIEEGVLHLCVIQTADAGASNRAVRPGMAHCSSRGLHVESGRSLKTKLL